MEHAHTPAADDHILAAFLEQGQLPDLAKRVNMSLAALANWVGEHAQLLTNLHHLLITRAKLLAAQLELAALSALATISTSATTVDDPKLRERALERQRKAANAILRHRTSLERTPRASGESRAHAQARASLHDDLAPPPSPRHSGEKYPSPQGEGDEGLSITIKPGKLPLAQRLAARRLSALAAS